MKKKDIVDAYVKFRTILFHLTCERMGKFKIGHKKSEKKVNLKVVGVSP
jgi:hypothetical protein